MSRLAGKTALITGAGTGIGAQIAATFADQGATVFVNDLTLEKAQQGAEPIGATAIGCDVSAPEQVEAMFAEVARKAGQLDILVNNAGVGDLRSQTAINAQLAQQSQQAKELAAGGPVETFVDRTLGVTDAEWRQMQAINVDGVFFCARAAVSLMAKQMSGSIINIASVLGTSGRTINIPYATSKAAVLGMTRALATDGAARNIRVNAIAPGWIGTDMIAPLGSALQTLAAQTPLGHLGEAQDIAWAATYLASDESKFMTGQTISPNGGWYMSQ